jgi:hypothetical protein
VVTVAWSCAIVDWLGVALETLEARVALYESVAEITLCFAAAMDWLSWASPDSMLVWAEVRLVVSESTVDLSDVTAD